MILGKEDERGLREATYLVSEGKKMEVANIRTGGWFGYGYCCVAFIV